MAKNSMKPRIRFKGFTDAWEQRKLREVFDYERPDTYIVKSDKYSDTYSTPVLTANKGFILGYTNEMQVCNKECIIFDDFTLDSKYVTFPFMVKSSALKILTAKIGYFLPFAYQLLQATNIEILGHARHYISVVQPTKVLIPSNDEQIRIGKCIQQIDNLITLHQRKYDKIVNIKKALLEKMFPAEGEEVPKIRFKGFTEAWEQREFNSIAKRITEMTDTEDLPRVEYEDIVSGQGTLNKDINKKKSCKTGILFDNGDVLFGKLRPYLKNWLFATFMGIAVGDFWVLRANNADGLYIYTLLQIDAFQDIANQSTGTKMPRADWSLVSKQRFLTPTVVPEQRKIGEFFKQLDNLITLHQRQLEKLKNIKSVLLEKMFV